MTKLLIVSHLLVAVASHLNRTVKQLDWCNLYSPIDPGNVNTIVLFDKVRNQYEWKLFNDMSCLLKRIPVLRLRVSEYLSYRGIMESLSLSRSSLCYEVIETINTQRFTQNHIAIVMFGESYCDIDATASVLAAETNSRVYVNFWKIAPCLNCSFSSSIHKITKRVAVNYVTLPFIKAVYLIPDMNIVHVVAARIAGTDQTSDIKKLYIQIGVPGQDPLQKLESNWDRGGNIAALVTLIFMFFLMSLFACCCVFTQSALVTEDFNYRDDIHMNWRDLDNGMNEAVPQFDPQLDTTMQTEATQLSIAEPQRRKTAIEKCLESSSADKSLESLEGTALAPIAT